MLTPAEQEELALLEAKFGGSDTPEAVLSGEAKKWAGTAAPTKLQELLGGAKHGFDRAAYGVKSLLPQSVQKFGDDLDRMLGAGGLDKDKYEAGKKFVEQTGTLSSVGDVGADVLMGLAPGGAALRGGSVLKQALASRGAANAGARLGTEMAGNAAWNAATAPEDRGTAAMLGAAGTVGGNVLNRALSGPLANVVTPEARRLMDQGVGMTAGQMISGNRAGGIARAVRGTEDAATSTMILGDVIKHRAIGGIEDWNKIEINKVLKDTGVKVKNAGNAGIDDAQAALRSKFDEVIDQVGVDSKQASVFLDDLAEARKHHRLLDDKQRNYIDKWVDLHITPNIKAGEEIPGPIARQIDKGIVEEVQKWKTKGGAWDQSLKEAFGELHSGWRDALESTTTANPEAGKQLKALIRAQDELGVLKAAAEKSTTGVFAPIQLQRVYTALKRPPSQTLKDAKATLPDTVPDTGTGARTILYHMLAPAGVSGTAASAGLLAGFGPLAGAAAGLAGAYTKTGTKYLASGMKPILDKLGSNMSREEMEYLVKLLSQQGARAGLNAPEN